MACTPPEAEAGSRPVAPGREARPRRGPM